MEYANEKIVKRLVKKTLEKSGDYLKLAPKNDSVRIRQAPTFPYKLNGELLMVSVQLKQNGKEVEAIMHGIGYRRVLFTFKLSDLQDSVVKKTVEKVKKVTAPKE